MVYLNLGYKLFRRKLFLNIVLIIQLAVILFIINYGLGIYNNYVKANKYLDNFDQTFLYYTLRDGYNFSDELFENNEVINEPLYSRIETGNCYIFNYGMHTSTYLKNQLISGRWIEENSQIIECVVSSDGQYDVGDSFLKKIEHIEYKFIVVGKIKSQIEIIDPSRKSYEMKSNMLFYEENFLNRTVIICSTNKFISKTYGNGFLFFDNLDSNMIDEFRNCAKIFTIDDLKQNTLNEFKSQVTAYLPLIICFTIIMIISLILTSVINVLNNRKILEIYNLYGLDSLKTIKLLLAYFLWLILGIIITINIIFMISLILFDVSNVCLKLNNVLLSVSFLLCVIFSSIGFAVILINRTHRRSI